MCIYPEQCEHFLITSLHVLHFNYFKAVDVIITFYMLCLTSCKRKMLQMNSDFGAIASMSRLCHLQHFYI